MNDPITSHDPSTVYLHYVFSSYRPVLYRRWEGMGNTNNQHCQNKVKIVAGHILMLLCDSSLESESHRCKMFFFYFCF